MNCPKCGENNNNDSKYCKNCGTLLEDNHSSLKSLENLDRNKVIIIALIAAIIILAIGVIFAGGFFKSNVPLETKDFELFTMDVPVGSNFEEFTSIPSFGNIGGLIYLQNTGQYSSEVTMFGVSKMGASIPSQVKFERNDGDVSIFKDKEDTGLYLAALEKDDFSVSLMGRDPDTMVKMLNTIVITDKNALASQGSSEATQTSSSSTPSSISILGGSFSTGSADSDKTYARINVGKSHAGENVIVQILYSRDGNSLNNGNMVPATVHSDGYLEISSADAYKYYPDHATIKIYDSNSRLLTTQSVSLSPTSGTQTF